MDAPAAPSSVPAPADPPPAAAHAQAAPPDAASSEAAPAAPAYEDLPLSGKLAFLGHFDCALRCAGAAAAAEEISRLGALMASAASSQDFETAIRMGEALKAAKALEASAAERAAWEEKASLRTPEERLLLWSSLLPQLQNSDKRASERFDRAFGSLDAVRRLALRDLPAAARLYAAAARSLQLLGALAERPQLEECWGSVLSAAAAEAGRCRAALLEGERLGLRPQNCAQLRDLVDAMGHVCAVARRVAASLEDALLEAPAEARAFEEAWAAFEGAAGGRAAPAETVAEIREAGAAAGLAELCGISLQPIGAGREKATLGGTVYDVRVCNFYRHAVSRDLP